MNTAARPDHDGAQRDIHRRRLGRLDRPGIATSPVNVAAVHFTPGARSAWHSRGNSGQTLYVTEGEGLVQTRGEPIGEIRAGDSIYTPADEWHWHGATPTTS
jgi:quercetin dioxygenase-like cupin family protein